MFMELTHFSHEIQFSLDLKKSITVLEVSMSIHSDENDAGLSINI